MKKKIMLHIIMPDQVSGPNNSAKRISNSKLSEKYDFAFLTQYYHAGGRINIRLIRDLMKQIKQYDPDIIHLSGLQSSGFHAVLASRLAGYSNIFLTIRGFAFDTINISRLKYYSFKYFFEPITIFLSKKVSIVTKESLKKEMVKRIRPQKFVGVIHNAAPIIDIDKNNESLRKSLNFSQDDFIVIIVGRMVYDKGISFISEAVRKSKNEKIKFLFVGDGPYIEEIHNSFSEEIKRNKIVLLGKQSNVVELMAMADVFLFATLHENLSNALLEAMVVGIPVICTKVGGNLEVIEDNINGLFVPAKDSDSIIEKINFLYENPEVRKKLSINAKNTIDKKFHQDVIYHQIDEIYKRMLD